MTARSLFREVCEHCQYRKINSPRGLCSTCYRDPVIRSRFPSRNRDRDGVACQGVGLSGARVPAPTSALPATPEKLLVLCQRAENGEALWHPDDARIED